MECHGTRARLSCHSSNRLLDALLDATPVLGLELGKCRLHTAELFLVLLLLQLPRHLRLRVPPLVASAPALALLDELLAQLLQLRLELPVALRERPRARAIVEVRRGHRAARRVRLGCPRQRTRRASRERGHADRLGQRRQRRFGARSPHTARHIDVALQAHEVKRRPRRCLWVDWRGGESAQRRGVR